MRLWARIEEKPKYDRESPTFFNRVGAQPLYGPTSAGMVHGAALLEGFQWEIMAPASWWVVGGYQQ